MKKTVLNKIIKDVKRNGISTYSTLFHSPTLEDVDYLNNNGITINYKILSKPCYFTNDVEISRKLIIYEVE